MLTFDTEIFPVPTLDEFKAELPDVFDVGESDLYWIVVNRKTRMIELTSKQTGNLIARCQLQEAKAWGVTDRQVSAAQQAMELKQPYRDGNNVGTKP